MTTKVLVVDDELDTLNLLRVLLELTGFEPITTLNASEAITLAEVEKVDVALLDIMMPKIDGFQLCRMMREHTSLKDLPIIFVTAYDALDLEDRRREVGADHVVHKPINIDLLTNVISDIQQKRINNNIAPSKPDTSKPDTNATKAPVAETPKADESVKPATPAAETPQSDATPKPEVPKPEVPKVADAIEVAKPAVPAGPMPMTFVSASSDDADDDTPAQKPAPPAAETPKTPEAKPETTSVPPATASNTPTLAAKPSSSSDSTSSKTDTTPIKPHRPPTPQ